MTILKAGSVLSRDISISDVDSTITVDITSYGISLRVKGSRKKVTLNWHQVIQHCSTEPNVKSFLMGKPLELLQHEAAKVSKRKE
jgi:hypothetical protein